LRAENAHGPESLSIDSGIACSDTVKIGVLK